MTTPSHSRPDPRPAPPPLPPPTVRTLRRPEDLLALVPTLFGFHPSDSLVLVGIGGAPGVHARVDLPTEAADRAAVGHTLLRALRRVDCTRVCLVAYVRAGGAGEEAADVLEDVGAVLSQAGVEIALGMVADGSRYRLWGPTDGVGSLHAYDPTTHPYLADAVMAGQVLHRSRAELLAGLDPVPALVDRVARHAHAAADRLRLADPADPPGHRVHVEARWANRLARRHFATGDLPAPRVIGRLLVAMAVSPVVRDAVWVEIDRRRAAGAESVLRHLVQAAPPDLRAAPAALLGFAAWMRGDGATAWCAVDASRAADPDYRLAHLLTDLLDRAVPPTEWSPLRRTDLGVPGLR